MFYLLVKLLQYQNGRSMISSTYSNLLIGLLWALDCFVDQMAVQSLVTSFETFLLFIDTYLLEGTYVRLIYFINFRSDLKLVDSLGIQDSLFLKLIKKSAYNFYYIKTVNERQQYQMGGIQIYLNTFAWCSSSNSQIQLWEVELLFLVYYVSNYILKYFATSNADDKFQQIISSWRLFMNYSLTQEGQKYDFDRIRPQSTIQSRYLIFQKGKIEITTCNKRTAMTKINAVEDVQGRSTNSLNKLRQF
ncbi:Hypothetical_protein [Hexamita inflata]|uniref:Hypothetical_protein n=1 Tax=Hexamita inflata TaxID=28002 RepID=A0AA86TU42_9EUKA|nr:Hypothetical protein HINF_LOCUS6501 [Hexamita inflata]CAI9920315.1 Hypothetical protein HINF_LOCUS7960 [Hexamita inflata]CAI9928781.1 Hypothetical protein HINF_LOCUS16426 [Hexamita inflata]